MPVKDIPRHTFRLYSEENGVIKAVNEKASFSELTRYSDTTIKESEENSSIWWLKGLENQKYVWFLNGKKSALRIWAGLVDGNDHGIVDDIGFVTLQYYDLVESKTPDNDNPPYKLTRLKHLMPVDWVNRELDYVRNTQRLEIESIVFDQVQRGISQGVAKAIQESTANLAQVANEKKRIDDQIAELQRERQRIEAIEARLQEREAAKQARKQQPKSRAGYVYLIRSLTALHYYKIGRSATPEKRMKRFEVKLPFEVETICLIQTDDMYNLESELHQRFADRRIDGEWFNLDQPDIEYIKSLQGD